MKVEIFIAFLLPCALNSKAKLRLYAKPLRVSVWAAYVVLRSLHFPASAGYILNGCNAGVLLLQGGEAGKRFRAVLPGELLAQLVEGADVGKVFHSCCSPSLLLTPCGVSS